MNIFGRQIKYLRGFPGGSVVNNPSAVEETLGIQVRSLGQEEPLEEKMTTHTRILAWNIPCTEEPAGLQSQGHRESDATLQARAV